MEKLFPYEDNASINADKSLVIPSQPLLTNMNIIREQAAMTFCPTGEALLPWIKFFYAGGQPEAEQEKKNQERIILKELF